MRSDEGAFTRATKDIRNDNRYGFGRLGLIA